MKRLGALCAVILAALVLPGVGGTGAVGQDPGPEGGCHSALVQTAAFQSFMRANPSLAHAPLLERRDAYVARGAEAIDDLIKDAVTTARSAGLIDPSDAPADVGIDASKLDLQVPDGVDPDTLVLPADHPFFLARAIVRARLYLEAGDLDHAETELLDAQKDVIAAHGARDARLLPILSAMADLALAKGDPQLAEQDDENFISLAQTRPDLERPLSLSIQAAALRVAAFHQAQADGQADLAGDVDVLKERQQADTYRAIAAKEQIRSDFRIENILSVVTGSLPGAAPLSLAQRNHAPSEPTSSSSLMSLIGSVLELATAVSADATPSRARDFGREDSLDARETVLTHCMVESGRAFLAWDVSAGMADFRTSLRQIDSQSVIAFLKIAFKTQDDSGDDVPFGGLKTQEEQDQFDHYSAYALAGLAGSYGSADLPLLADTVDQVLSNDVLAELGKQLAKAAKAQGKTLDVPAVLFPGIVHIRAVLTDLLREPSGKTVSDTRALRDWLAANEGPVLDFLAKSAATAAQQQQDGNQDGDQGSDDQQTPPSADDIAARRSDLAAQYPLLLAVADGLSAKAATAAQDLSSARRAAATQASDMAAFYDRAKATEISASVRSWAKVFGSASPDDPAYLGAAMQFSRLTTGLGAGMAANQPGVLPQALDDPANGIQLSSEQVQALQLLATDTSTSMVLGGSSRTDADLDQDGSAFATLLDLTDDDMTKDRGPDWEAKIFEADPDSAGDQSDATLAADTGNLPSRLGREFLTASQLIDFGPLIERMTDVIYPYGETLPRLGKTREVKILTDLTAAALNHFAALPHDTRMTYGRLLPDGLYLRWIDLMQLYGHDDLAERIDGLWREAKLGAQSPVRSSDPRLRAQAWAQDRAAWAIGATFSAWRAQRAGGVASEDDQTSLLEAVQQINRSAAGEDFETRLRIETAPADVRDAYARWRIGEEDGETWRYNEIYDARRQLEFAPSIANLSPHSQVERRNALRAEEQAWDAYQDARKRHGMAPDAEPLSVRQVADSLRPDEVLLTGFQIDNERLVLVAITRQGGLTAHVSGVANVQVLRKAIDQYKSDLSFHSSGATTFHEDAARAIWAALGEPFRAQVAQADRIIWAPPQGLGDFPLSALEVDGLGDSPWLGLDKEIMVIPSLDALAAMRAPGGETQAFRDPLLAVGDIDFDGRSPARSANENLQHLLPPTPAQANTEFQQIAQTTGATALLGPNANKGALEALQGRSYAVAVFFTHGVDGEVTSDCGSAAPQALALYQDSRSGCAAALLTPQDAARLDLRAGVVILAACSTEVAPEAGLGPLDGLTRAFLLGGARSVVGAHLPVDPTAAVQMSHELTSAVIERRSGVSFALRQTMLRMARDPATRAPAYWAQFEVVGEGAAAGPG